MSEERDEARDIQSWARDVQQQQQIKIPNPEPISGRFRKLVKRNKQYKVYLTEAEEELFQEYGRIVGRWSLANVLVTLALFALTRLEPPMNVAEEYAAFGEFATFMRRRIERTTTTRK